MRLFINISIFFFLLTTNVLSDEAANWLKKEIDVILNAYTDTSMTNEARFLMIENTINYNFAGAGIAKFVSGDSWSNADKVTKKAYIKLFKRHLALNIASLLQGYSNQQYELSNSKYDSKSKVSLINMEIFGETGNLEVTWRVKQAKDRFFVIDFLTFSKVKSLSLCAPPNGSNITSSIIFNSKRSFAESFIAVAASRVFVGSLHNIVAQPSGEITE